MKGVANRPPARMPALRRALPGCPCPANPHRPRAARRHTPAVPAAPDPGLLRRYAALEDLSGAVSDALDQLGLQGAVPASALAPTLPRRRLVGQAVTVRNVPRADSVAAAAASGKGMMGEHEAYNLAEPGDVVSSKDCPACRTWAASPPPSPAAAAAPALSSTAATAIPTPRANWASLSGRAAPRPSPASGGCAAEINGTVHIASMPVQAGDLVVADDAGVVFVPHAQALAVLEAAERVHAGDARQKADIARGVDLATLAATRCK